MNIWTYIKQNHLSRYDTFYGHSKYYNSTLQRWPNVLYMQGKYPKKFQDSLISSDYVKHKQIIPFSSNEVSIYVQNANSILYETNPKKIVQLKMETTCGEVM